MSPDTFPSTESAAARRSRLAKEFERQRPYLRSVAYRMLGSLAEAEDALQECWLRLDRRPPDDTDELRPWLTTVIGRICLDMLRSRRSRREELAGSWLPEPIVVAYDSPEDASVRADSVGLALLVVLEQLSPAERLAFVLHDVFAVSFDDIAPIVGRSPDAARQLASRGRRRVQAAPPEPEGDRSVQRQMVDAFLAAAREGEFEALLELLDPDVTLRLDTGGRVPELPQRAAAAGRPAEAAPRAAAASRAAGARPPAAARPLLVPRRPVTGARRVAAYLRSGAPIFAPLCRHAIVNGGPGLVVGPPGQVIGVVALTLVDGRVREVDIVADPAKLERVRLAGW